MAATNPSSLVRDPRRPQRATHVELFYDLVFLYVLARLAESLAKDLTWLGAYRTLLLLVAVWWVWAYTNLVTDTLNSELPSVQLLVIGIMFGTLIMSTAVADAIDGRALLFAGVYVAIHVGRSAALAVMLRNHPRLRRRPWRGVFWFSISGVFWIGGALLPGAALQLAFWTVALLLDYYLGPTLRWPTPWIGRSQDWEWNLASAHLAERYRQFIIIGFGETIVISGRAYRATGYRDSATAGLVLAFAATVLLWWIYFYRTREKLGTAITTSADPARETKWAGHAHLVMVAGIVLTTAGDELLIQHAFEANHVPFVVAMVGGPTLFLAGRVLLGHEVFVHVARPWLIGIAVLVLMSPAMLLLPPIGVAFACVVVLLGVVLADAASGREAPGIAARDPSGRQ